MNKQEA